MHALTHKGVAVQERMRQSKVFAPTLARKTCEKTQPDGSKCAKQMTADQKKKFVFCPTCLKNIKAAKQ
jgi:hypothetical protein